MINTFIEQVANCAASLDAAWPCWHRIPWPPCEPGVVAPLLQRVAHRHLPFRPTGLRATPGDRRLPFPRLPILGGQLTFQPARVLELRLVRRAEPTISPPQFVRSGLA